MKTFDLSLYLVLDPDLCRDMTMIETARAAVAGGVTMVQLRHKHATTALRIELGRALKAALSGTAATLIINDDLEAAVEVQADGLHIGQQDIDADTARQRIGNDMILGVSCSQESHATGIDPRIVDYAGIGPVFGTATKPDHDRPLDPSGLRHLVSLAPVPAVAIGGLKLEHVNAVLETGASGLAVVSAICGQADPEAVSRQFADRIRMARIRRAQ